MPSESHPVPPAWLIGMGTLTFGLVAGFMVTALPFLLAQAGIAVNRIATVSAVAMSPTFWAFLLTPIVDAGLTRRTYAFVLALGSAAALGAALWLFTPARLSVFTALLLLAEIATVLQASAVGGWTSEFVSDSQRGKVGGWSNAANLGGGALGAMLVMWSSGFLPLRAVGVGIATAVVASTLVLLRFPRPHEPQIGLKQMLGGTLRSVLRTSRRPEVLTGFLIFLAPASCAAAIDLFAGLGRAFHATPQRVLWVTGAGVAGASSLGSLCGGYIADRMDRGVLYVSGGVLVGLCSIALALTHHTQTAFTVGALAYNALAGVCYAAFSALGLQLVGNRNPAAATQLALFAASSNAAIVYMTWVDGRGYRWDGARGLFLTDGLASFGAAIPLLLFLRWRARRNSAAPAASR